MKIVNKKKFIRSIILLEFISILFLVLSSRAFSYGEITYRKQYVAGGDTIWKIAEEVKENNSYYENKSIGEIVFDLKRVNDLKNSQLSIGQELKIPTYFYNENKGCLN